jgi:trehalose/maltose hydrolase-like predicted phosphorylase
MVSTAWPLDQPRATFGTIAGFWDVQQNITHTILPDNLKRGGESVISGIPDWTALTLTTSQGHSYQPGVDPLTVKNFYQSMSIRDGIVHTNITWSPHGDATRYQLNYTVVAHRTRLNLGIVRLDIAVDQPVTFKITDILDGAGAVRASFHDKALEDGNAIWTSVQPWGIAYCTAYLASTVKFESSNKDALNSASQSRHDGADYPWVSTNSSTVAQSWDWRLEPGDTLSVYKFVGIASTTAFPDRTLSVAREAAESAASDATWDQLLLEHTNQWDATWEDADIIIPGDEDLQTRVRASLFHILASLLPEDTGLAQHSIMVGGLSSDSYAGLIFWDADTWIYPSVLALHPQYSTGINNYREGLLAQAEENARYYNYSGALYAWTSGRFGNCTGTGVCKGYQYHLNTDIALAHWQYFQQTNDLAWLAKKGWPVIKSVADMFAAYVSYNASSKQYVTIQLGEPVSLVAQGQKSWERTLILDRQGRVRVQHQQRSLHQRRHQAAARQLGAVSRQTIGTRSTQELVRYCAKHVHPVQPGRRNHDRVRRYGRLLGGQAGQRRPHRLPPGLPAERDPSPKRRCLRTLPFPLPTKFSLTGL